MSRPALALVALLAALALAHPAGDAAAQASDAPSRDPRNWPTVTRLVQDRFEQAGRVVTLRVHARRTSYYNCGYRGTEGQLMAFTLLGGPLETLTGYMPTELGRILADSLERDPWAPITVQVRFDPARLSELCPDQVDILKWSQGWQYPDGSLPPGRPDPTVGPRHAGLDASADKELWDGLMGRKRRHAGVETEGLEVGAHVQLTAGARLDTAYHCVFKGADRTHYALRLHNAKGDFAHAYVPRTPAARALMDFVALHRDVALSVQARVVKQALSHYCRPQLEVIGWTLPEPAP